MSSNAVVCTETYHNTEFLDMLLSQRRDSPIFAEHIAIARSLKRRLNGQTNSVVNYTQRQYSLGNGRVRALGRYWPANKQFVCCQNMLGKLRKILADGRYVEVDVKSAHLNILSREYLRETVIRQFCDNRDEILQKIMQVTGKPRSVVKELFIRLTYGGSLDAWRVDHNVEDHIRLPLICESF